MNEIVSYPQNVSVAKKKSNYEESLDRVVKNIESQAASIAIADDAGYAAAGEFVKEIKRTKKNVADFWEPTRLAAKQAYDHVRDRIKEMTGPLDAAEKIISRSMGAYADGLDRKRRQMEERMRSLAREEVEAKLAEAAELDSVGDQDGANAALEEAEIMADVAAAGTVSRVDPKANGVSTRRTWDVTVRDPSVVPISICGTVVHVGDKRIVERLVKEAVKATGGDIIIPGVDIEAVTKVSIRI